MEEIVTPQQNVKNFDAHGKVEVEIEGVSYQNERTIVVRVDGREMCAIKVSASLERVGMDDYSDGHDTAVLRITQE